MDREDGENLAHSALRKEGTNEPETVSTGKDYRHTARGNYRLGARWDYSIQFTASQTSKGARRCPRVAPAMFFSSNPARLPNFLPSSLSSQFTVATTASALKGSPLANLIPDRIWKRHVVSSTFFQADASDGCGPRGSPTNVSESKIAEKV